MIVLDTHAWIWLASDPDKLSKRARQAIDRSAEVAVSAISVWEVATKVAAGRLRLDRDVRAWTRAAIALPGVTAADVNTEISLGVVDLAAAGFPGDPADRLIVSTAVHRRCPLLTKDRAIRAFAQNHRPLDTVW